jgi:hypothetical protein
LIFIGSIIAELLNSAPEKQEPEATVLGFTFFISQPAAEAPVQLEYSRAFVTFAMKQKCGSIWRCLILQLWL